MRNIKRLKQQVDTVKATESLQQAQNTVAERYTGSESKLHTAMDSLERIKEKQVLKAAKINAAADVAKETGESSLEEKLLQAGIVSNGESAQEILARLAKKKASQKK